MRIAPPAVNHRSVAASSIERTTHAVAYSCVGLLKMQVLEMKDQLVAWHENDGPSKSQGVKMHDTKNQDLKLQDLKITDRTKLHLTFCATYRFGSRST